MDVTWDIAPHPDTGEPSWVARLSADRYELRCRDGVDYVYDRLDDHYIPGAVVGDMIARAATRTPSEGLGVIPNIDAYCRQRRGEIQAMLTGASTQSPSEDASEDVLQSLVDASHAYVILTADVVDSSSLTNTLDAETTSRIFGTLATELSELIGHFYGHVLRYEGDGIVAFFPEPVLIIKNDLAVDCATCMRRLVSTAINPELESLGYPPLRLRFGLDTGEAIARVIGSSRTKRHPDLFGDVISLACNIRKAAGPGEILMGDYVARNLHTAWRLQTQAVPAPPGWSLRDLRGQLYALHQLSDDPTRPVEVEIA